MLLDQNFVNKTHAICDCIPFVSTLTNGAELIYRLAHKVHSAADSITPGIKTSLKIHALSKDALDYLPIIPILGNLFHFARQLIQWALGYKADLLQKAIDQNNIPLVEMILINEPLKDLKRTNTSLNSACQNQSLFRIILSHRLQVLDQQKHLIFSDFENILGMLTPTKRKALIGKLDPPVYHADFIEIFRKYFNKRAENLAKAKNEHPNKKEKLVVQYKIQLDIFNELLSNIEDKDIGSYLQRIVDGVGAHSELVEPLITQHETKFTPQQKGALIRNAIPSPELTRFFSLLPGNAPFLKERIQQWGRDVPAAQIQAILVRLFEGKNSPHANQAVRDQCQELIKLINSMRLNWTGNGPANNSASVPTET